MQRLQGVNTVFDEQSESGEWTSSSSNDERGFVLVHLEPLRNYAFRNRSFAKSAQLRQSRPDSGLVVSHFSGKSPSNILKVLPLRSAAECKTRH